MTMNLTSSVIQPIFGYLTDRWNLRWLLPLGVAVSGLGMALVALAPDYWTVLGAVVFYQLTLLYQYITNGTLRIGLKGIIKAA